MVESPAKIREVCQAGKSSDPAWYFVHRRVSIYLTWLLLHTPVTPNQVSLVMMSIGAVAAGLLAPRNGVVNLIGFALLYFAFLLDKVDGEIARYRGSQSVRGLLLDRLHHLIVEPLVFLAAARHDWLASGNHGALTAGWASVVLGNLVDEHQHLSAYILFKHLRGARLGAVTGHARPTPEWLRQARRVFNPLKAFRMFIVVVPMLAVMYLIEWRWNVPAVRYYLYVSAVALTLFLVFQSFYYFGYKLEAEIDTQASLLADGVRNGEHHDADEPDTEDPVSVRLAQ